MRPHSIWDDEPPPCEPTERDLHEMQGGCPPESGCSICWPGESDPNYDPTPWCSGCGARTKERCKCGPIAEND